MIRSPQLYGLPCACLLAAVPLQAEVLKIDGGVSLEGMLVASDPPPDCNAVEDGPCHQKCVAHYEETGANCGKIQDEAQRKTCQDSAYEAYKTCRATCRQLNDCLDHCKDLCVEIWEGCTDKCGKDRVCKEKCMGELISCNAKCEEKCK